MTNTKSNKIYWFCFKQQLRELYYLLYFERFIRCKIDEFISHFTGKKFIIDKKYSGKLSWNKEKYLLLLVANHLFEKKFIADADLLKKHFDDIPAAAEEQYNRLKNKSEAKRLQQKLDILFPIETGYRCKQRLYYRHRNKQNEFAILGKCGVVTSKPDRIMNRSN
jgi:hypothetical protein